MAQEALGAGMSLFGDGEAQERETSACSLSCRAAATLAPAGPMGVRQFPISAEVFSG